MDLLRQINVLPHWDNSRRSNLPSHQVTVCWPWANQSLPWPCNSRHLGGQPPLFYSIQLFKAVLPLQEVALHQSPPTFSVLCYPCPNCSLLLHNVISPRTFRPSNWSYALYLLLWASNNSSTIFHSGDVSSPFSFHIGYILNYVCHSGSLPNAATTGPVFLEYYHFHPWLFLSTIPEKYSIWLFHMTIFIPLSYQYIPGKNASSDYSILSFSFVLVVGTFQESPKYDYSILPI